MQAAEQATSQGLTYYLESDAIQVVTARSCAHVRDADANAAGLVPPCQMRTIRLHGRTAPDLALTQHTIIRPPHLPPKRYIRG